jgi:hypothetical protein
MNMRQCDAERGYEQGNEVEDESTERLNVLYENFCVMPDNFQKV